MHADSLRSNRPAAWSDTQSFIAEPIKQPSAVIADGLDGQSQRTAWPRKLIAHSVLHLWWKATTLIQTPTLQAWLIEPREKRMVSCASVQTSTCTSTRSASLPKTCLPSPTSLQSVHFASSSLSGADALRRGVLVSTCGPSSLVEKLSMLHIEEIRKSHPRAYDLEAPSQSPPPSEILLFLAAGRARGSRRVVGGRRGACRGRGVHGRWAPTAGRFWMYWMYCHGLLRRPSACIPRQMDTRRSQIPIVDIPAERGAAFSRFCGEFGDLETVSVSRTGACPGVHAAVSPIANRRFSGCSIVMVGN